jgi:hypothetical protein
MLVFGGMFQPSFFPFQLITTRLDRLDDWTVRAVHDEWSQISIPAPLLTLSRYAYSLVNLRLGAVRSAVRSAVARLSRSDRESFVASIDWADRSFAIAPPWCGALCLPSYQAAMVVDALPAPLSIDRWDTMLDGWTVAYFRPLVPALEIAGDSVGLMALDEIHRLVAARRHAAIERNRTVKQHTLMAEMQRTKKPRRKKL